ncbi:MAG: bifunctional DNA-binding transcriptional regulator/O6-methylguanine-DNA methyltransferase Ada [bacterium]
MHALTEQEMYQAVCQRDPYYDGQFVCAVKTTGIYCRPSCPARTPKQKNILFFSSTATAKTHGYRPCKRCHPDGGSPLSDKIIHVASYIEKNADTQITLKHLAELTQLSPSCVQKSFKEHFGVSPKQYQDSFRIKIVKETLKAGEGVTSAIYNAGFGSPSRLYENKSKQLGMTPSAYRAGGAKETITYCYQKTSLGQLLLAATAKGVCFVQLSDEADQMLQELKQDFPNAQLIKADEDTPYLKEWVFQLQQWLVGKQPHPDIPVDMRGTAFQILIWNFLRTLEEGQTLTYSELAAAIDKPKAVRAAASACARNRIALLIPCHRILCRDGGLGGYRWGAARKQALLAIEHKNALKQKTPTQ